MKRSKFFKRGDKFWRHEIPGCTSAQTQGQGFRRKKYLKKNKKAQMKMSFGMIFSIILIVIFIAFAFYAIKKFLGFQDAVKIGQFKDKLEDDINKIWKGSQGSQTEEYYLPKKIGYACFVDYGNPASGHYRDYYQELKYSYHGNENIIFYPVISGGGLDSFEISHIDLEKITKDDNPFCIENIDGKVTMIIEKDFGENFVSITK